MCERVKEREEEKGREIRRERELKFCLIKTLKFKLQHGIEQYMISRNILSFHTQFAPKTLIFCLDFKAQMISFRQTKDVTVKRNANTRKSQPSNADHLSLCLMLYQLNILALIDHPVEMTICSTDSEKNISNINAAMRIGKVIFSTCNSNLTASMFIYLKTGLHQYQQLLVIYFLFDTIFQNKFSQNQTSLTRLFDSFTSNFVVLYRRFQLPPSEI